MDVILALLNKWQTLLGAALGGVFAVVAALLVAYKVRRQEDLAAAMLVVGNLVTFRTAGRALNELLKEEGLDDENVPYWYSEKLARRRLKLSPVFEASRVRLMPVSSHLAAHLEMFQVIFSDVDARLDVLEADINNHDATEKTHRKPEAIRADAKAIHRGFLSVVQHAECAECILTLRVLSNYPTFHAIRMALFGTKEEKECRKLFARD